MANTPINALTATFGGGDQTAIKMDVTDSGPSNSLSKLIDLQIGGTSKFKVTKEGYVTATNYTGSFSGSVFLKNTTSAGNTYLVFADGSGRRTLKIDTSGVTYDPGVQQLTVPGDILYGGSLDTTNATALALPSPTTVYFAGAATTLVLGNTSAGSITNIATKRTTGTTFEGRLSGSHSGSVRIKNISSDVDNNYVVFSKNYNTGQRILGAASGIFFTPSTGVLVTDGGITTGGNTTNGDIDSAANSVKLFESPETITIGESCTDLILGKKIATSFTKILSNQVRGNFTGSFTGSFSGSRANFTKLSGSNARIAGRVIATSYTGSISGSDAKFINLNAKNLTITNVIAKSFTGSLSGSIFIKNETSSPDYFDLVFASGPGQQTLNVDPTMMFYDPSNNTLTLDTNVYAGNGFDVITNPSPSLFATPTSITLGSSAASLTIGSAGASSHIIFKPSQNRGHFTGSFTGSISGSTARFTRINSTRITSSIFGVNARFTKLSASMATIPIAFISRVTGSISGSVASFAIFNGKNATFLGRVKANTFSGSLTSSRSNITHLTASNVRVFGRVRATSFTGSFSGSKGWSTYLTASNVNILNNLNATRITGSIRSEYGNFDEINSVSITGSAISSSKILVNQLTASKVKLTKIIANSVTSSLSGSVYVNLNNTNNDLYVIFTPTSVGQSPLYTDGDLYYNPFTKLLTVQGSILIDNLIDSTSITTASLFNSVPTVIIGENSLVTRIGKNSSKVAIGNAGTLLIVSGSITSSLVKTTRLSSSRGRIEKLSGSHASFQSSSAVKGNFTLLTSSFNLLDVVTGSYASFGKNITASNARINNDALIMDDLILSGSFNFRYPLTGSGPSSHKLFISGAGALQGYMGIMINNTRYKIPLYAY